MEVAIEMQTRDGMISKALAQYGVQDAAISEMRAKYMPLKANGIQDRKGLDLVHDARMVVARVRIAVEKKRVELKADALEFGRAVDGEAKRITALITPIEDHLAEQESCVEREKARIKAEAERARAAKLDTRMSHLRQYESALAPSQVEPLADDQFIVALETARVAYNAIVDERERVAAEAKAKSEAEAVARKAEQKSLDAQREQMALEDAERRKEQERIDAANRAEHLKLHAERAAVDAERRKVEAAAADQRRQAELEAARKDAVEKALADAEAKRVRDAAEKARIDALAPDREKVRVFADLVYNMLAPECAFSEEIESILRRAAGDIMRLVGDDQ